MQRLCGIGEVCADAVREEHRLALVGDVLVHDRAVPVPMDVGPQALVRIAPAHLADLGCRDRPLLVAVEGGPEVVHLARARHVHEGVAQVRAGLEVHREVDEVVLALEAAGVHVYRELALEELVGQVPDHEGGDRSLDAVVGDFAAAAASMRGGTVVEGLLLRTGEQRRARRGGDHVLQSRCRAQRWRAGLAEDLDHVLKSQSRRQSAQHDIVLAVPAHPLGGPLVREGGGADERWLAHVRLAAAGAAAQQHGHRSLRWLRTCFPLVDEVAEALREAGADVRGAHVFEDV
mmetsp:Transcript_51738/g.136664  ORF Transcript_51738/g.136664 Transcript_51738/m.136664 type:complete len:290 (+) Transcript_51738:366-1235(+)